MTNEDSKPKPNTEKSSKSEQSPSSKSGFTAEEKKEILDEVELAVKGNFNPSSDPDTIPG